MATWYVTFDEPYAIEHHGIKGQKWGIRRFQNPDGSLTEEGMRRYNNYKESAIARAQKQYDKAMDKMNKHTSDRTIRKADIARGVLENAKNMSVKDALDEQGALGLRRAYTIANNLSAAAIGVGGALLGVPIDKTILTSVATGLGLGTANAIHANKKYGLAGANAQASYTRRGALDSYRKTKVLEEEAKRKKDFADATGMEYQGHYNKKTKTYEHRIVPAKR